MDNRIIMFKDKEEAIRLTESEKIMTAGCAAGIAAAAIPTVYGYVKATAQKPIADADFLKTENGGFVSDCGEYITLRGVNLNDDLFYFQKADLDANSRSYDVFAALESRFGRYGARQLVQKFNEGMIAPSDIKYLRKLGANCVRIPLRYRYLYSKENCKGDIDFDRLDFIIEKCKKAGIYVILDLHSAPGFQNNGSACSQSDRSVLFESSKEGFEARNAVVRLWTQVASHYKDEPAVAAYDLLNRPLYCVADWENKLDTLHKFYRRIYKAIRHLDDRHIVIMQAPADADTLPSANDYHADNVAYGLYSHFRTTFETDALVNGIRALRDRKVPFVICKVRSEDNTDYSLTALNDSGASWLFGDFKGSGNISNYLFSGNISPADLTYDSYEEIGTKWSKPLSTKNFTENKETATILKGAFKYGNTLSLPESAKKGKLKVRVKFGFNVVKGINKPEKV